jgi:hypothetical protein
MHQKQYGSAHRTTDMVITMRHSQATGGLKGEACQNNEGPDMILSAKVPSSKNYARKRHESLSDPRMGRVLQMKRCYSNGGVKE